MVEWSLAVVLRESCLRFLTPSKSPNFHVFRDFISYFISDVSKQKDSKNFQINKFLYRVSGILLMHNNLKTREEDIDHKRVLVAILANQSGVIGLHAL